jgi:hypothetical protein
MAMLKLGAQTDLELHLIDAATGERRNSTVVPLGGEAGALDAAVMRLDEEARRRSLGQDPQAVAVPSTELTVATVPEGKPAAGPPLASDPGAWARQRWPLLTAIGVAVGTALVLGIAVANDSRSPR